MFNAVEKRITLNLKAPAKNLEALVGFLDHDIIYFCAVEKLKRGQEVLKIIHSILWKIHKQLLNSRRSELVVPDI